MLQAIVNRVAVLQNIVDGAGFLVVLENSLTTYS